MRLREQMLLFVAGLAACAGIPGSACGQDDFASDAARLVTALKLQPGQTVADIGAGRGELTVELAREVGPGGQVYATELDADRLRDIREAAAAAGLKNVTVVEAHATRTNLPAACCDALVLRRVYHHIRDPSLMNESMRSRRSRERRPAWCDLRDGDAGAERGGIRSGRGRAGGAERQVVVRRPAS